MRIHHWPGLEEFALNRLTIFKMRIHHWPGLEEMLLAGDLHHAALTFRQVQLRFPTREKSSSPGGEVKRVEWHTWLPKAHEMDTTIYNIRIWYDSYEQDLVTKASHLAPKVSWTRRQCAATWDAQFPVPCPWWIPLLWHGDSERICTGRSGLDQVGKWMKVMETHFEPCPFQGVVFLESGV